MAKPSAEEKSFRSKLDEISIRAEEFKKKTYSATGVVDRLTRIFPGVFDRPQPYGLMVAALRSANAFKTSLSLTGIADSTKLRVSFPNKVSNQT